MVSVWFRRFRRLSAPGALLIGLLQRTPTVEVSSEVESVLLSSPVGDVLRAVVTAVASLGAIQSMAGATPLVPSSGSATGFTTTVGTPVSIGYSVTGTQTPPASWKITGSVPPGLNFSGLTGPGIVNVETLTLTGTPTTAQSYSMTITAYEGRNGTLNSTEAYPYSITVQPGANSTAPTITTEPQGQSVAVGGTATFTVVATGSPTPAYQWQKDGTALGSATSSTLTLTNVQAIAAGNYTVVVSNSAGTVTSTPPAVLTVLAAPVFTLQPRSQTVTAGDSVTFSATVSGASSYRWQKNNVDITGATAASYTLANVATGDAGNYTLVATNPQGSTTSSVATLTVSTVSPSGPTAWLSNLSVRSNMASGQTLIVGFTVTGGAENVLVRAVGPTLATVFPQLFPPSSVMADPRLSYYPSGASAATMTNEDWDPSVGPTITSVGAFPFPAGSKDAALVPAINGPNNTAWVQGTGSGTVLVEGYALGSTNTPRLTNISARNHVGTGADILIAGFVLKGTGTKNLLIRGIGPALADVFPQFFSASSVLGDPKLEIYDSTQARVASNNDWDPSLTTAFDSVGAYRFVTGSKDAAIIVTLPASATGASYTAQVSGADGGTGEGVVEVYELP